jgi:hypothetical protein
METISLDRYLPRPLRVLLPFAPCMLLAVSVTMLFGAGLAPYFPGLDAAQGAGQMLLIAGTGWAVTALLALALLGENRIAYIHAMGDVKHTGVMILLPATVLMLVAGAVSPWFAVVSVALSSSMMLRKHIRLMRGLGIPSWMNAVWLGSLWTTALAWVFFFHAEGLKSLF